MIPTYDADQILTMTDLEDYRNNSSQYVKSGGIDTDCQLLLEIILNASDEAIDPNRTYDIKVVFFTDGAKYQVSVQDHGRGIPVEKLVDVYTKRATSGKYNVTAYNGLSSGCWGVGSKLTNALSDHFVAISKRPDAFAGVRFARGVKEDYKIFKRLDKDASSDGTTVVYQTDPTIVRETNLYLADPRGLPTTLKTLDFMSVFKPNLNFMVYRVDKLLPDEWWAQGFKEQWIYLNNVTGEIIYQSPKNLSMFDYSKQECGITSQTVWKQDLVRVLNLTDDTDRLGYKIEIGLTKTPEKESGMIGIVNGNIISVPKASHMAVLQTALKSKLTIYLDEDNTELRSFFEHQYQLPLHGYVNVQYKNAKFISQTKTSFENVDFARQYRGYLLTTLNTWPDAAYEQLFDLIQTDLAKKFNQNTTKTLNTGKSLKNVSLDLKRPDSYYACETKDRDRAILHIVEGESSGNSVVQLRNPSDQAVYELRGKCLNTFTAAKSAWVKDDVYSDLVRLLGVHPQDKDLSNMNFREICIMADADPDGLSIIDLLIGMIYNINPLILEQGRVTIAMPPLYVLSTKDKVARSKMLRSQHALDDAQVVIYENYLDIGISTLGGPVSWVKGSAYRDLVYLIKHLSYLIESVSNKLAIDPFIVEQMCHCIPYMSQTHVGTTSIKNVLSLDDCIYNPESKVLVMVKEKLEVTVPLDKLIDEIVYYIKPELDKVLWQTWTIYVSTKHTPALQMAPKSIWQMRQLFERFNGAFEIRRIKGLGECQPDELRDSCLNPATRTVVRIYGVGDVQVLKDMLGQDTAERKKLLRREEAEWMRGEF